MDARPDLPPGHHAVPAGHLAAVVTHLERRAGPDGPVPSPPPGVALVPFAGDLGAYRALFRLVGRDWLWMGRLAMTDADLAALLADPDVPAWTVTMDEAAAGLLELDLRDPARAELAYFGLTEGARGRGIGRWLMAEAVARAFARPIEALTVHTCTLDSAGALSFYVAHGFTPVRREVEIFPDPRATGLLDRDAAPGIPDL